MNNKYTAAILAGGKSTRMGFDKQLLTINEIRLINYLVKCLKTEFEEIILVTNTLGYHKDLPCKIVCDEIKDKGPLSGIHAALKNAKNNYVYFIACDMPIINLKYIEFLKNKINNIKIDACITKIGEWIEPFNAFYSKNIITDIETYLNNGKKSVHNLMKHLNCMYIEEKEARQFSPNWDMFLNLNTKDDLKKCLENLSISI